MKKTNKLSYLILVVIFSVSFCFCGCSQSGQIKQENINSIFSSWKENSTVKNTIISYISEITDTNSADFIPKQDRIAVFDLDGTIMYEGKNGDCFMNSLLYARVFDDPTFNASDDLKENVRNFDLSYKDEKSWSAWGSAFSGMSKNQFKNFVNNNKDKPVNGYHDIKYTDLFFKPMLELIEYLNKNDFKVYIVSGSERECVRAITKDIVDIPTEQVIGADYLIYATSQGDESSDTYTIKDTDELIMAGETVNKNMYFDKVISIDKEIGKKPVLSFGNSESDYSMLKYVASNNKYNALSFLVDNDDEERTDGTEGGNAEIFKYAEENGYGIISVKENFDTVFLNNAELKQ